MEKDGDVSYLCSSSFTVEKLEMHTGGGRSSVWVFEHQWTPNRTHWTWTRGSGSGSENCLNRTEVVRKNCCRTWTEPNLNVNITSGCLLLPVGIPTVLYTVTAVRITAITVGYPSVTVTVKLSPECLTVVRRILWGFYRYHSRNSNKICYQRATVWCWKSGYQIYHSDPLQTCRGLDTFSMVLI
jgi:hypothetical protein